MRIRGKRVWLTVAAIVAMLWWCHGRNDDAETAGTAGATTTAAQSDLSRFIAHLPTPSQLKLHPFFIEVGELRLEGQTIDADKQPIAGAKVTLNGSRTTVSEADGSFSFDKLSATDYVVAAEKDTFYGEDTVTLTGDSDPDELEMKSGPSVRLHVVDRNGMSIRDAKIDANRRSAVTDVDGNAVVHGLDLKGIRIEVTADGFGPDRIDVDTGDDPRAVISKTIVLSPGAAFGGTVVDESGKPVAEASVSIGQGPWRDRVDTDAHGKWKVPYLAAGKVTLSASSNIHLSMPDQTADHDGIHDKLDVVVHVVLGARATGMVVDGQGKPVADATVSIGSSSGHTDDNGKFVVEGITPGLLVVYANSALGGSLTRKVQIDRTVELRFELVDSSIAGIVRDARGEPVADATLEAKGTTNEQSAYARSDEFGKFDFGGIPPGEYEVTAQRDKDRMGMPEHGLVTRTTNRGLAVVVSELGTIAGHVVLDGAPVDYFGIAVSDDPELGRRTGSPDPVRTQDGAFLEKDLRPGVYTITIVGPTFKRKQIPNIRIADGASVQLGAVEVERGHVVRGTVHDDQGRPVVGALVTAGPSSNNLEATTVDNQIQGTRGATSDAFGNFEIAGLEIAADATDDWIQATHGDEMCAPQKIRSDDAPVDLMIVRTGAVDGRIVNVRYGDQSIYIESVGEGGTRLRSEADAVGAFHFDHVPPGDYTLSFGYTGTVLLPMSLHVDSDTTTPITIELPPATITVVATSSGCDNISMQSPEGRYVDLESCKAGSAVFPDVAPGTYEVCARYDQCQPFTVTVTPTQQTLTIQPTPPEVEPTPTTEPVDLTPTPEPTPAEPEPEPDPDDGAETQAP
ncbi:MAG TPA: carboxypeptidase regulatory-like domain-containing protein [Kofleriaceae bacterium]